MSVNSSIQQDSAPSQGSGGLLINAVDNGLSLSNPFREVQLGQGIGAVGSPANLLNSREIPLNGNELHILPGTVFFPSGNVNFGPISAAVDDGLGQIQVHETGGANAFATFHSNTVTNIFGATPDGGLVGTQSNDDLQFFTHGGQHMVLTKDGFVSFTERSADDSTNFDLRLRNLSLGFPVIALRPSGHAGFPSGNIAFDIMPVGTPGDYLDNGTAWIDVCNADVLTGLIVPVQCARVSAFSDKAVFGSVSFGPVITVIPVVFVVDNVEVARFDTAGNFGINQPVPLSQVDILGANGFSQLRLETSFTPANSADPNGNTGDVAWDANFWYVKTGAGAWKRTPLLVF